VDKYGSHIVDAAWRASDLNQKVRQGQTVARMSEIPKSPRRRHVLPARLATNQTAIAGELANREGWVATSFYGQMALRNCNVDKFKRRRQEWNEAEEARARKTAMFADLLADEDTVKEEPAPGGKKRKVDGVR